MNVYTLSTRADAFFWLCRLEGELLSIRAFERTGLYPSSDDDEGPAFECAVYNSGLACGEFIERLQAGDIEPLTAAGQTLLDSLDHMGRTLCSPVWEQAVNRGAFDAWADRAICDAGADGWPG